jgi:flagellar hook-associated protein 2
MALLSFSGLASGLDTGSIVEELVKIRRRPLDLEIANRAATQETRDAFGVLETKLLALRTALRDLRTADDVRTKIASSSDTAVLTATAGRGAATGTTTVTVTQLATVSRATAATGLNDLTDTVAAGAGTFAFTVGGGEIESVALTPGTTLEDLVDAINALGAGVGASAINVGSPGAPSYKLQIVATDSGSTSDLAIVTDGTTLGISATAAANAQFTISGFAETIERSGNTVSDVIPGVTLVLRQAGTPAEVTVTDDEAAVEDKIQAVVDAFNELVAFVEEQSAVTRVDEETTTIGPLAANPTVRGTLARLRDALRTSIPEAAGGVTTLSHIGIATGRDGTLAFDTATFQAAFAANPQGVGELLGGVGSDGGVADLLHDAITELTTTGGLLPNVESNLDAALRRADDAIQTGESAIDAFRADLEAQFAALETTIGTIQSQGDFLLAQLQSVRNLVPRNRQ